MFFFHKKYSPDFSFKISYKLFFYKTANIHWANSRRALFAAGYLFILTLRRRLCLAPTLSRPWSDIQASTAFLVAAANRIGTLPSGNTSNNWWKYKYPSSISLPSSSYQGCGLTKTWKTDCRHLLFFLYLGRRLGRDLLLLPLKLLRRSDRLHCIGSRLLMPGLVLRYRRRLGATRRYQCLDGLSQNMNINVQLSQYLFSLLSFVLGLLEGHLEEQLVHVLDFLFRNRLFAPFASEKRRRSTTRFLLRIGHLALLRCLLLMFPFGACPRPIGVQRVQEPAPIQSCLVHLASRDTFGFFAVLFHDLAVGVSHEGSGQRELPLIVVNGDACATLQGCSDSTGGNSSARIKHNAAGLGKTLYQPCGSICDLKI